MIIITNFPFFSVHCLVVAQKTFALRQRCQGQQPWKLLSGNLLAESLRSSHCDFLTSKSVFFCRQEPETSAAEAKEEARDVEENEDEAVEDEDDAEGAEGAEGEEEEVKEDDAEVAG